MRAATSDVGTREMVRAALQDVQKREVDREFLAQDVLDVLVKPRTNALPWRGQFTPGLVQSLLGAYVQPGSLVLDPFTGSGTTLVEAMRMGMDAVGSEVNPAALELAGVVELASRPLHERKAALREAEAVVVQLLLKTGEDESLPARLAEQARSDPRRSVRQVLSATLLLALKNGEVIRAGAASRALATVRSLLLEMPDDVRRCQVHGADARSLPLEDGEVDAVITSPPYINVFNYHQNYRPATELLGWNVLPSARSEIGANRKHRQNRFLTVIQYCLDMRQAMGEIARVTKAGAPVILVLGRESRVMNVPFPNGEIVATLGELMPALCFERWQERSFMNRFGESIYEEVLTFRRTEYDDVVDGEALALARELGVELLREAPDGAASELAVSLVQDAIAGADAVRPSPLLELSRG